jgi:hypothetical protein
VSKKRIKDGESVGEEEQEEDRHEKHDRFSDPAEIEHHQEEHP